MNVRAAARLLAFLIGIASHGMAIGADGGSPAGPIELFWVIRVGPIALPGDPAPASPPASMQEVWLGHTGPEPYGAVREELLHQVELARTARARATILLSGDFAEEAIARGHQRELAGLVREGFEIGTFVSDRERLGTRRWVPPSTRRRPAGIPGTPTATIWTQHREWVSRIVGDAANRTVEAAIPPGDPELSLATKLGWRCSCCRAGERERETGEQAPGPYRNHDLVEIDHSGQVGDPLAAPGDASVFRLEELAIRRSYQPSPGVRALGFLTRAAASTRALRPEVERFVLWLVRFTQASSAASATGRRARWATAANVRGALVAWEAATSGRAGNSGSIDPGDGTGAQDTTGDSAPAGPGTGGSARDAHVAAIQRLRDERRSERTSALNLERRWWALGLWRLALMSLDPARTEAAYPASEQTRLASELSSPGPGTFHHLDDVLGRMERAARAPPGIRR